MAKLFIAFHLADSTRTAVMRLQATFLERLQTLAGEVEPTSIVRPVPVEKMHLTAVFIGEVDAKTVEWIGKVFGECAASLVGNEPRAIPGPSLAVGGIGAFPSERRPRVVWAGAGDPTGRTGQWVEALRASLTGGSRMAGGPTSVDHTGFAGSSAGNGRSASSDTGPGTAGPEPGVTLDSRPFVPHITIAYPRRRLNRDHRRTLQSALNPGISEEEGAVPTGTNTVAAPVPRVSVVESIPTSQGTQYKDLFWIDL